MRCQKVRSCLPAYCENELTGREVLAVREHLSTCVSCRDEEVALRALANGARELPNAPLTGDFNTRLLNRIAQERFTETRTKAYLPRRAPRIYWRTAAPVLAGALVLVMAAVAVFTTPQQGLMTFSSQSVQLDDSYRTIQPSNNPNMVTNLKKNWSLHSQLAQTERLSRLSGMLTRSSNFTNVYDRSAYGWGGHSSYSQDLFKMRPVIRIYQPANSTQVTEARAIY